MIRNASLTGVVSVFVAWAITATAMAQPQQAPAAAPQAKGDGSLVFEIHQIGGKVRVGADRLDPKSQEGWSYAKVGDVIGPGQQIHVPWRGTAKLVARPADPATVMLIERSTLLSFSELSCRGGISKSRIKLAYGAVSAGVAEGTTRSDMEIEAPVATLSKRGTDIFRMEYHNGNFRISLSDQGRGMLQAMLSQPIAFGDRGLRSLPVAPGQWATQLMARIIENVQYDTWLNVNDQFGFTDADERFVVSNDGGLGFLQPQGGNVVNFLDSPTGEGDFGTPEDILIRPDIPLLLQRNAGDFGIGQGQVPGVFVAPSPTAGRRINGCDTLPRNECKLRRLRGFGRRS